MRNPTHATPMLEELWRHAALRGLDHVQQAEVDPCARVLADRARISASIAHFFKL